jgi:acetyl-CoA acetyltransferase/uncharacterized OB-fold protein
MAKPLPLVTPENEFFWKAGAEGALKFQKCGNCGALLHPPGPMCPYCRSAEIGIMTVSGRGVVAGYTVNYQQWSPDFPPPYVLAVVAIEEDPRVRLTTNLADCAPEEARVGMRVQVRFEERGDVWLPVFAPTGEAEPGPVPEDEPVGAHVRPMARAEKFEDKVAITGIGQSRIGRRLGVNPLALTIEACRNAVADAGLRFEDIDGLSTYPGGGMMAATGHSEGGIPALEEALRIRPVWFNGGSEIPGQAGSVIAAMLAVAAGMCRHVLCYRTVWEATYAERQRTGQAGGGGGGRVGGDMQWLIPYGAMSAANWIAVYASQHMYRYGTPREALGTVAMTARANAALNPTAIYRQPLTMEEYLSARMISTPFGLYDCDVPCDGAVALVVSAVDAARDLRQPPVRVEAVGTQIIDRISWDQGTLAHEPQSMGPGAHLWSRTSMRPADVDVALLYDGFSFLALSWLEGLGFCKLGEGGDFLKDPARVSLTGELPLNPHGGQLSAGRTHGYGFIHEAIVQLRGEGGERQVKGAQVAVVTTGGGTPGGAILFRRER